jgi:ATP sulfurylase
VCLERRGFSPLEGFMDEANYSSVVDNMRTADGLMYGLPVVLDTADESVQVSCLHGVSSRCDCVVRSVAEPQFCTVYRSQHLSHGRSCSLAAFLSHASSCCARVSQVGQKVLLQYQGKNLAVMEVESKFVPNKPKEAKNCYGTSSLEHPGVQMISMERGKYYLGGKIHGTKPAHSSWNCFHLPLWTAT